MIAPLYTWIDVEGELRLKQADGLWPVGMLAASAYHDVLDIRVASAEAQCATEQRLGEWFGARYSTGCLHLEALPDSVRCMRVEFEIDAEGRPSSIRQEPGFRTVAFLPERPRSIDWPEPWPPGAPLLVAYYSFKGGVGRTTQLLALVKALSESSPERQVLMVDADLEAPGITALATASGFGRSSLSLVDFLALAHSDPAPDSAAAIELAAARLHAQPLRLRTLQGPREHYLLPAYRDERQALTLEVRPEHLQRGATSPWRVCDLFMRLGQRLGVAAVLLDLRAGLSELAAPILFDPRVKRVVVSTPSHQSVEGTKLVLRQLLKLRPPLERGDLSDPVVMLGLVPPSLRDAPALERARESLLLSYPDGGEDDAADTDALATDLRLRVVETDFAQELLVIESLDQAMELLGGTSVARVAETLARDWFPAPTPAVDLARMAVEPGPQPLERLRELAGKLEYAESGAGDRFLTTPPLRALAQRFERTPPVAVVIGQKGSGKTFTYLQHVRAGFWSRFAAQTLGQSGPDADWGRIWPLLEPRNLGDEAADLVRRCRRDTLAWLRRSGLESAEGSGEEPAWSRSRADEMLAELRRRCAKDESRWRRAWLDLIATSLGLGSDGRAGDAIERLSTFARERGQRLVVVVDGLEEAFQQIATDEVEQAAVRALLQAIPERLLEIPNSPLGLVVFARADLERAAVRQNTGQFERLYEPFMLRWNAEQAVKLVAWICQEARVVELPAGRTVEALSEVEATRLLDPVWGARLGSEKAKEARTASWVLAALSDLRGQVQARDLVRLLRHAAEGSTRAVTFADRLLQPRPIREALRPCSTAKIDEVAQEIPLLARIFEKLRKAPDRRLPFDAASVKLARSDVQTLESVGVVLEDEGKYYMPEIFRLGLGYTLRAGARPRVLSLARRARSGSA